MISRVLSCQFHIRSTVIFGSVRLKVFTYRYFLHRFPELCILAVPSDSKDDEPIGCVVCKIDDEDEEGKDSSGESTLNDDPLIVKGSSINQQPKVQTGYIAMLAVDTSYRRSGIGSTLVQRAVTRMKKMGVQSITLETEITNEAAMRLYEERFGFVREELLVRYYLNWSDAYRLRLWLETTNVG